MGYYTDYSLYIEGDENLQKQFGKELFEMSNNDSDIKSLLDGYSVNAKLYDICDWIDALAPKYPELLICLRGNGEGDDDSWETRWKGDEEETQTAIIPPFENPNLFNKYDKV